jgi:hypothetical protein
MAFRSGYGQGVFTADLYGIDSVLIEGAAAASISSAATAVAEKVVSFSATAPITTTASGAGFTALAGAATSTSAVSVDLYWNRVRPFAAQDNIAFGADVKSRYKWNDIAPPTTTWVEADYREGAA